MTLTYTSGRLGSLKVGSSYTTVLGVQQIDISMRKKDGWPDVPTGAPLALALYNIDWSISGRLTEDLADAGQDDIREAFFYGTSLLIKAYRDATHYYSSTASVTQYDVSIDPEGHVVADFELDPYRGEILTPSL